MYEHKSRGTLHVCVRHITTLRPLLFFSRDFFLIDTTSFQHQYVVATSYRRWNDILSLFYLFIFLLCFGRFGRMDRSFIILRSYKKPEFKAFELNISKQMCFSENIDLQRNMVIVQQCLDLYSKHVLAQIQRLKH